MTEKLNKKFLGIGLGVVILCCFTPILVILLGIVGLSWFTGYLDYGLAPLLGFFVAGATLVFYSHYQNKLIAYAGIFILLGSIGAFLLGSIVLGILVAAGAFIAGIAYFPFFKKFCKDYGMKK